MENDLGLTIELQDGIYVAYNKDLEGVIATGKTPERAIANYNSFLELQNIVIGNRNER